MLFYPKSYFKNVLEIKKEFLKENNIKAVLLDIDNTLIDTDNNVLEGLEAWTENLKKEGIKFCIVSNTNQKKKAERMSKILDMPFIYFAKKPLKFGFKRAQKIVKENNENIAVVGDQALTDVLGANRCKMYSILVAPLKSKDIWITRINRIIEKQLLKEYFKKNDIKNNKEQM